MRRAHMAGKARILNRRGVRMAAGVAVLLLQPGVSASADDPVDDTAVPEVVDQSVVIDVPPADGVELVGPPRPEQTNGKVAAKGRKRPPIAEDIDLSEPVVPMPAPGSFEIGTIPTPVVPEVRKYGQPSLVLLNAEVEASTSARLSWSPDNGFESIAVPTPVLVVNGSHEGPTLCVTAAVHGDELNGIEVVRRVLYELDSEKLTGAVIGVPIVNLQGFRRASRYLPDRRDLNRYFPGNTGGSSASRLAHSFFSSVISHCDALVDVHTGSFHRSNLPQLRADLDNAEIRDLTEMFGATVVLHSPGAEGTLRRAATDAGIPAVTLEAGEPARLQDDAVAHGARGIMTLMNKLGMYDKRVRWKGEQYVYRRSKWERADRGGVLFSEVELGQEVEQDQLLGTITDPITNLASEIRASHEGRILGMALPQFVLPGFAAYRIGIEGDDPAGMPDIETPSDSDDLLDVGHGDEVLGVADEFDGEGDDSFDERDSVEDSE